MQSEEEKRGYHLVQDEMALFSKTFQDTDSTPLRARLLASLLLDDVTYRVTDMERYVSCSTEELFGILLECLENRLGRACVERAIVYMNHSKRGLADTEVMDLLSGDADVIQTMCQKRHNGRIPLYAWAFTKAFLEPYLTEKIVEGVPVVHWRHQVFRKASEERYGGSCQKVYRQLLAYFTGKQESPDGKAKQKANGAESKEKKGKKNFKKGTGPQQNLGRSQKLRYGDVFNSRRLDEVPWLLGKTGSEAQLIQDCLLQWEWLDAKLRCHGVNNLLEDFSYILNSSKDPTVKALHEFFVHHQVILRRDPEQFNHLLRTHYDSGKFQGLVEAREIQTLLEKCNEALGPRLELDQKLEIEEDNTQEHILAGLFWIKGDADHVISVSPIRGDVAVWDFRTRCRIRKLTGLRQPKDLRMCGPTTAVILCDRELKVYDLDNGTLVSTLKGVLNLRMPYFGVHSEEYTIAMARNRMYVNMLKNSTGDVEATFKAGEDRFMDSLLVNDNGDVCVCGDAVQKPFPLLVWDLRARKLIYDLRIVGHDFLTKMAAISSEGSYMLCVAKVAAA